ncbi:MAG TPA: AAA family ATPase, partial [Vicinamibacterales bacterium]
ALRFNLSERAHASKTTLLYELEEILKQRDAAGESTVLVVDEAQSLPREILEEVRLLANIETVERKLLSVILAGQPEVTVLLNDPGLRQLKQRIALRCELRPLTLQETAGYLAGRIRAAGGLGAQVFTREAVTLVHERSAGVPRTISVIADNALLTGFAVGQRPVNSATVREVCRDFDLGVSGADPTPETAAPDPAARSEATPPPSMLMLRAAPTPSAGSGPSSTDSDEESAADAVGALSPRRRLFSFLRG